jgi:hypothetical protein
MGELLTVLIKDRGIIRRSVGPAQNRLGYHEAESLTLVIEDALPVDPAHDPFGEVGGAPAGPEASTRRAYAVVCSRPGIAAGW